MGGCQNYGSLLGPLNTRCRVILRTQKGTMILSTTHINRQIYMHMTSLYAYIDLHTYIEIHIRLSRLLLFHDHCYYCWYHY